MKKGFVTKNFIFFCKKINIRLPVLIIIFIGGLISLHSCASTHKSKKEISLDIKIGQMLNIGFRGLSAGAASAIVKSIEDNHIGGVVLFDYDVPADSSLRNIQSPQQLKKLTQQLQDHADTPLFISIDQEGGQVSRLKEKFGFPPSVSARYLGSIDNIDSTRYYARQTANVLRKAGINLNLAPVVDLNSNPKNPVIGSLERSFSGSPEIVSRHAKAYIDELHAKNICTALKHFPGHGSSEDDSHKGIVDVSQTWHKKELIPYKNLINNGYDDVIMTAHIFNSEWDSTYPATLSKQVIHGMLRDSLSYNGVVMSDDLQMGAIRKHYELKETIRLSIQAGVDILTFANNSVFDPEIAAKAHRIISELVDDGLVSEERITRSYKRIMNLKERINDE